VNTCTGYLCPGLTSYVAEDLGLGRDLRTLDIVGMGCGGALPNLEAAAGLLALNGQRPVLSIAVEMCSATLFMGTDPALIVSNSIFGDGAAAVVLQNGECDATGGLARVLDFASGVYPQYRDQLHYRQEGGRLRNVLSIKVPKIGAKTASEVLTRLLNRHHLTQDAIQWWAVHAGGTAVLDQVGRDLGLPETALRFSMEVFHNYGNMSSPSVLFALKHIIEQGRPKVATWAFCSRSAPGFRHLPRWWNSCESSHECSLPFPCCRRPRDRRRSGRTLPGQSPRAGRNDNPAAGKAAGRDGRPSMAIGIMPPSLRLFESIALAAPLVRAGCAVRSAVVHDQTSTLGCLDFTTLPAPFPFILSIPQGELMRLLRERLADYSSVRFMEGCEAIGLRQNTSSATVQVRDVRDGTCKEWTAAYVVACDGRNSTLRRVLGVPTTGKAVSGILRHG
jgi:3-oxoacyl-[acyl-carrier-protein] synthase III